jgi:hypothetical protein
VGESILVQVTRLFAHALHRRVSSVPEKANGAGLKYCGKDSRLVAGVTQTAGDLRELSHGAVRKSDGGIFSGRSIYESTFFCLTGYLVGFFWARRQMTPRNRKTVIIYLLLLLFAITAPLGVEAAGGASPGGVWKNEDTKIEIFKDGEKLGR